MATLEEKQSYYEYGRERVFKLPPRLDPVIEKELLRFGRDENGDPLWRFCWGGACIIRSSPSAPWGTIRGNLDATRVDKGRLVLRYLDPPKMMSPIALCFKQGKKIKRVKRESDVPKGAMSWWEYEYTDFGHLRWFLERKLTAAQLVEAKVFLPDDPYLPRQGEYISIMDRPIETPDGKYFEPTMAYLEVIAEHLVEEQTESMRDLLTKYREKREKREQDVEHEKDKREFLDVVDMVSQVMREPVNPTYSIPENL